MFNIDNSVKIFQNEEFGQIRTIMIDGEPWFVGKDVAKELGYGNTRQALKTNVGDEDKGVHSVDTLGGIQELTVINESGLYSLILSSKLPSAKKFKHWVTSEVLPTLRKTGSYHTEGNGAFNELTSAIDRRMALMEERMHMMESSFVTSSVPRDIPITYEDCLDIDNPDIYVERSEKANRLINEIRELGRFADERKVISKIYTLMKNNRGVDVAKHVEAYKYTHPTTQKVSGWYVVSRNEALFNVFITVAEEMIKVLRKYTSITEFKVAECYKDAVKQIPYLAYVNELTVPVLYKKIYETMALNGVNWSEYEVSKSQAVEREPELQDVFCRSLAEIVG